MNILLYDSNPRSTFFPLTLNKAVASLRYGIFTIKERWEHLSNCKVYVHTVAHLQPLYEPLPSGDTLVIDAAILPNDLLVKELLLLSVGESVGDSDGLIAQRIAIQSPQDIEAILHQPMDYRLIDTVPRLTSLVHLLALNDAFIRNDWHLLSASRTSQSIPAGVQASTPHHIFIEAGAEVNPCFINASTGPVYIGCNAVIMEGCMIRGPFAMGEKAVLKMGTKVYGATTIGPYCTAGGEIKNSILSAYSNKAHDGYLGDSILGEWCNMGAGTTNSNVKNTGGTVHLYNYDTRQYSPAGNKFGVVMGDYSRTAINTSINTGTVVGLCCNVFGNGLTPKWIPDFSWGFSPFTSYHIDKAIQDVSNWKQMKDATLSEPEVNVLRQLYEQMVGQQIG